MSQTEDGSKPFCYLPSLLEVELRRPNGTTTVYASPDSNHPEHDIPLYKRPAPAEVASTKPSVPEALDRESQLAVEASISELEQLRARNAELEALINTPHTSDWLRGVELEAAHQRERWSSSHDAGKTPADWFWLLGYLAGKSLAAALAGDVEKALHHTISSGAALLNWHRAMSGVGNEMRPGLDPSKLPGE